MQMAKKKRVPMLTVRNVASDVQLGLSVLAAKQGMSREAYIRMVLAKHVLESGVYSELRPEST